jgi:maltooligosyltrehalose synthase
VIAVAPRLTMKLTAADHSLPLGERSWGDTRITTPGDLPNRYRNVLTGETFRPWPDGIRLADALAVLPVALLSSEA